MAVPDEDRPDLFRDRRREDSQELRQDLDLRDRLFDAVAAADHEVLRRLAGEDPRQLDNVELLRAAVHRGDAGVAVVRTLLELGCPTDVVDECGETALCLAARGCDFQVAKALLDHGADPNLRTPIIQAARSGCPGIVRMLVEAGADPNRLPEDEFDDPDFDLNRRGESALFQAVVAGAWDVVAYLAPRTRSPIRARARVAYRRRLRRLEGFAPRVPLGPADTLLLDASARCGLDDAGAALVQGASIDPRDDRGRTPLWRAADAGHLDMVRLLLRLGADVEAVDRESEQIPLIRAVLGSHAEVVTELVAAGSDPGNPDNQLLSARDYAREVSPEVAEALERAENIA